MKSKGLGDTIEKITKATGIKKLADKIPGGCGCKKRKDKLNNMFPYKNKELTRLNNNLIEKDSTIINLRGKITELNDILSVGLYSLKILVKMMKRYLKLTF